MPKARHQDRGHREIRELAPTLIVHSDENEKLTIDQLASFVPTVIVTIRSFRSTMALFAAARSSAREKQAAQLAKSSKAYRGGRGLRNLRANAAVSDLEVA